MTFFKYQNYNKRKGKHMGNTKKKIYSLADIVYENEEKFAKSGYTLEQLKVSEEKRVDVSEDPKLNELQTQFQTSCSNMKKNINKIFEIFALSNMQENFQTGRKYLFDEKDKEFIVDLLKRYSEERIWKKGFKKITPTYRGVWCFFQSGLFGDIEILNEIEFVVNGLLRWFTRLHNDTRRIEDLKKHLYLVTSLNDIKWVVNSKKILVEQLAVLDENEMGSFAYPRLMKAHSDYLEHLTYKLEDLMKTEKNNWEDFQKKKLKEAQQKNEYLYNDEEFNELIQIINEEIHKNNVKGAKDILRVLSRMDKEDNEKYQRMLEKYLKAIGELP